MLYYLKLENFTVPFVNPNSLALSFEIEVRLDIENIDLR